MDKNDKSLLKLLGIKIDDNEISIDFNKAKESLKALDSKLDETASKIRDSLKEGKIDIPTVGIELSPQKFEIDIKQTKETIDSLVDKLSNLSGVAVEDWMDDKKSETVKDREDYKDDEDGLSYICFEIGSKRCDKKKIAKIMGLEPSFDAKESWILSTPKVSRSELNSSTIIKILESRVDELKRVKKECEATFTLSINIVQTDRESDTTLSISSKDTEFLGKIGCSILLKMS